MNAQTAKQVIDIMHEHVPVIAKAVEHCEAIGKHDAAAYGQARAILETPGMGMNKKLGVLAALRTKHDPRFFQVADLFGINIKDI
jgi:hypothetical protein